MQKANDPIKVYTDGACSGNPGVGGWANVFCVDNWQQVMSGNDRETTSNRMELTAVIKALEFAYDKDKVDPCNLSTYEIYSDSAYVVNAMNNHWLTRWKLNKWKTKAGDDVKNIDLWVRLSDLLSKLQSINATVKFIKVKGHSGNEFNELADKVAVWEVKLAKEESK